MTSPESCVVETEDGRVCGYESECDGVTCYKFKGIPYAKPPLGGLRFLPPSPICPWKDVKDCTKDAPAPLQYYKTISGSEDCLYIEVVTPNIRPEKPLPVMFWTGCHGFICSLDSIYDPNLLIAQDVIYVRCGFRIGPMGFISIQDFTAPGNCGLKDILMALKWVQRNINAFGGDPNNVTIFGSGMGGAIVHMMVLSPMAAGLFDKAIIQSVSALNHWTVTKNPTNAAIDIAKILGIESESSVEVIEKLRALPAMDIMEAFVKTIRENHQGKDVYEKECAAIDVLIKPCVEVEFEGQPAFLTKSPVSLLKSGNFNKVPLLIGSNNIEAPLSDVIKENYVTYYHKFNENLNLIVPKALSGDLNFSKTIGQKLVQFYLGGEDRFKKENVKQYLQLVSDYYFLYYINKTVRLHVQLAPDCPVYYYIKNFAGDWTFPKTLTFLATMGHLTEVPFIFKIKAPDSYICKGSRETIVTRNRVVKMWTNFAKYGNPTPEDDELLQIKWDPVENSEKLNYLSISSELTKGRNPFQERMKFWDDLYIEYRLLRTLIHFNDMGISW